MNRRKFLTTTIASSLAIAVGAKTELDARKLRVGVIGHTGRGNYGHGLDTMWLKLPDTEIVGVADPIAEGLAGALKRLNITTGFADYREMLTKLKPDIVAIGMRYIDQHRDVALAAIESGVRGIYMEKPFCRTLAEADEIIAACDRKKVKLAVAHRNRYHPVLPVIELLVKEGTIGRLLEIRARGKEDQRGGPVDLWVLGSHVLNHAVFFGGKPVACSAVILQDGRPVTHADVHEGAEGLGPLAGNEIHARFETERGIPIFFDSVAKGGESAVGFGLQLLGTKGVIDLRTDKEPLAQFLPGSPYKPTQEPHAWTPISSAGIGKPEPIVGLEEQLTDHLLPGRDLIAAIREDRQPLCSAQDGRVTIEMITAVFESHRLNDQRVTFPLKTRGNPFASL